MDKAGQGGIELAVLDIVGGIIGALPSTRWRGFCPSRVTLPDSLNRLLRAGRPAGSEACTVLSTSLLLQWGDRCQVRSTKAITFSSFQSSPRSKPTAGVVRGQRAHSL